MGVGRHGRSRRTAQHRRRTDQERWLASQRDGPAPSLAWRDIVASALRAGYRRRRRVIVATAAVYCVLSVGERVVTGFLPGGHLAATPGELGLFGVHLLGLTFWPVS